MFEVPASEDVGSGGTTTCAVTDEIASGSPDAVATAVRFAAATCCSTAAAAAGVADRIRKSTAKAPSSRRLDTSRTPITSTCQLGSPSAAAIASPRGPSMAGVKAAAGRSLVMLSDTTTDGAGWTVKVTAATSLAATSVSVMRAQVTAVTVAVAWSRTVALGWRAPLATQVGGGLPETEKLTKADAGDDGAADTTIRAKPECVAAPSAARIVGGGGTAAQTVSDALEQAATSTKLAAQALQAAHSAARWGEQGTSVYFPYVHAGQVVLVHDGRSVFRKIESVACPTRCHIRF